MLRVEHGEGGGYDRSGNQENVVALLLMVGMYAAVIFGMKLVGKYLATKSANRDDVKAELEQAKQDAKKLDPEGKRIVLTEEYLKAEYKDYYASKV